MRRGSAAARCMGLWVRIPPGAWMSFSWKCCVLSSGNCLCHGTITRPAESIRLWRVLSVISKPRHGVGLGSLRLLSYKKYISFYLYRAYYMPRLWQTTYLIVHVAFFVYHLLWNVLWKFTVYIEICLKPPVKYTINIDETVVLCLTAMRKAWFSPHIYRRMN